MQTPKHFKKTKVQASVQRNYTGGVQAEARKRRFAEQWGFSRDVFVALWAGQEDLRQLWLSTIKNF